MNFGVPTGPRCLGVLQRRSPLADGRRMAGCLAIPSHVVPSSLATLTASDTCRRTQAASELLARDTIQAPSATSVLCRESTSQPLSRAVITRVILELCRPWRGPDGASSVEVATAK